MTTINFDEMLARIAAGGPTPFRITYVVRQGKSKGQLREFVAWYGAPNPKTKTINAHEAPKKQRKTLLETANLFFTEFGSGRLLTLFVYNITQFNGKQVI